MKKIERYVSMFKTVVAWALNPIRAAITNQVQAMSDGITELTAKSQQIETLIGEQQMAIKGNAIAKKNARGQVCLTTNIICAQVYAFAVAENNPVLAAQVKMSLSDLLKVRTGKLGEHCKQLYNIVNPYVPSLAAYDITTGTMTDWMADITAFNTVNTEPRQAIAIRKQQSDLIDKLTTEAAAYCRNTLDKIATSYINIDDEYYAQYRNMRRLIPNGINHSIFRTTVVMGDTNSPVIGAVITISGVTSKGTTDIHGYCKIEKVKEGLRQVTFTAQGYESYTTPVIEFKKGQFTTIDTITLIPSGFVIPAFSPVAAKTVKQPA